MVCDGFRIFFSGPLGTQALLEEVAVSFKVSWAEFTARSSGVVGDYGLKHRVLENIRVIGVDGSLVRVGRVFWTLLIDGEDRTRLLWVGHDRKEQPCSGLNSLGEESALAFAMLVRICGEPYSERSRSDCSAACRGPLSHPSTAQQGRG